MKTKIYYHHTDSGGVVYYANYLKFLEEARTEFFAQKGFSIKELADKGMLFVVSRQEIDYKYPAFYGDILDVRTWLEDTGKVRLNFAAEIINQDSQLVSQAKTILVCVDKNLKPQIIPEDIIKRISNK